jgi:lipoprotein-anchoring transpeptidase ErfK/SrfK
LEELVSRLIKQFAIASLMLVLAAPAANANFVDSFFNDLFGPMGGGPRQTIKLKPGAYTPGEIVVSFGDRRLYFIETKTTAISYSIAIPKAEAKWSGVSYVSQKRENPVWTPTADMRKENPKLPAYVAGGDPRNPLGTRAMYLGDSMYRIHGTDAEYLIGEQVSHGCIRMYNADVADLYKRAKVGAKVVVTWNHFNRMQGE